MSYVFGTYLDRDSGKTKQKSAVSSSSGAGDAGKLVKLDGGGRLDTSMMPSGIGAEVIEVTASGALSEFDLVNIFDDTGTLKARKADAGTNKYVAHGYAAEAILDGATGSVQRTGFITGSSLTPGAPYYLSDTPGGYGTAPPTGTGKIDQVIGYALSDTVLAVEFQEEVELA